MRARPTVTTVPLPAGRGCVNDVATLALDIPLFPVDRLMRLDGVAAARQAAEVRIGWAAIFLKAYAVVARETPALRSWLAGRFRQRIATSSESVAVLAVNRGDGGDDRLFFARLSQPDTTPLPLLQASIDRFVTRPVEEAYRRQLELESVPGWLRRTILRWNMRSTSPKRVTRIGTFSLSLPRHGDRRSPRARRGRGGAHACTPGAGAGDGDRRRTAGHSRTRRLRQPRSSRPAGGSSAGGRSRSRRLISARRPPRSRSRPRSTSPESR